MDDSLTRRRALGTISGATVGLVAGCSGDGAEDPGADDATQGTTEQTEAETATATAEGSGGGSGTFTATTDGDWPTFFATPQNNHVLTDTSVPSEAPEVAWEFSGGFVDPAIVDGTVYVDRFEEITAIDLSTGEIQWTYTAANEGSMTPTVVDGTIYTFDNGGITAIDAATGERQWTDEQITAGSLQPADGRLLGTNLDHAYAFDPAAREVLWRTELPGENPDWNGIMKRANDDQRLYVVEATGEMTAFDNESGDIVWTRDFPATTIGNNRGGLNVAGDGVYLYQILDSTEPTLRAMDGETGEDRWTKRIPGNGNTPLVTTDGLYLAEYLPEVEETVFGRFDPISGQRHEQFDAIEHHIGWQPVLVDDTLLYWEAPDSLAAVDLANDEQLWDHEQFVEASNSLVATDGAVLYRNGSKLKCLQAA